MDERAAADAEMLRQLYAVEFPPALLQFAAFMRTYPSERWTGLREAVGLSTTGPLGLILRHRSAEEVKHRLPMLLHWRFFRDPPEFFTCLHGDSDGLHYGLLLDEPAEGFRGAASYYNNDGDIISVYRSLFDAVVTHVSERIEGTQENLEYDPGESEAYERDLAALREFREDLEAFMAEQGVVRDDRRPEGVTSDTGLGVVVPTENAPAVDEGASDADVIGACRAGNAAPALLLGRSLWYWSGAQDSSRAHTLLSAAYDATDRPFLKTVLDVHFENRDLRTVDVVESNS